jgi:hypothetical protein
LTGVPIFLADDLGFGADPLQGAPADARRVLETGNPTTTYPHPGYFQQLLGQSTAPPNADHVLVVDFRLGGTADLQTVINDFEGNRLVDPSNPHAGTNPPLREEFFIADLLSTSSGSNLVGP